MFAEKGFGGATLDEVALRAELGKGTLYNYFPDGKDELLFAIFEEIYDDLTAIIERSFPETDPETWRRSARARFRGFITRCFEYFEERENLFLILAREAHRMCLSDDPQKLDFFLGQRHRVTTALSGHVQRAIELGAMRPFPPHAVADMLFGNINGLQMHRALERAHTGQAKPSGGAEAAGDFLSTFLFDGLLIPQE